MDTKSTSYFSISEHGALAALGTGLIILALRKWLQSIFSAKLPPGPIPLPLVGNLFSIPLKDKPKGFTDMAKKYGDITYFHGLGQKILIVNNRNALTEIMVSKNDITAGRPTMTLCGELAGYDKSIVLRQPSKEFREMRKAINLAVGKGRTRERPMSIRDVGVYLKKLMTDPEHFLEHNRWLVGGFTLNLAYGYRPQMDNDPFIKAAHEAISEFAELVEPGQWIVDFFPILKYLPMWTPGIQFQKKAIHARNSTKNLSFTPWRMVKKQLEDGTARPSFCADLISSTEGRTLTSNEELIQAWLPGNIYAGGSDTTVSTLGSFFMAMCFFPEVKHKAMVEVDSFINSKDRLPTIEDRECFPYIQAIVIELFRWGLVAPLGIPHRNLEDIIYNGHLIPEGTAILTNAWSLSRDESYYPSPEEFRPERFLGEKKEQDPREFAFGSGRRVCPGRDMAEAMLLASIPAILAVFDIQRTEETFDKPSWSDKLARHPTPFKCKITVRNPRALDWIESAVQTAN